jgi:outer membrane protein assembly factor BamB
VFGGQIYLTSGDPQTAERIVMCINASNGRKIWQRAYASNTFKQHRDNSYATASPAADDLGVVVSWTTPEEVVLLALAPGGDQMWRRSLGKFVGPHGSGSSPIILDDLVVLACEQENIELLQRLMNRKNPTGPAGDSFLIAVDRKTGKTRWRRERRTALAAYSTPCVRRSEDGRAELVFTSTAHGISGVDVSTGELNWEIDDVFADRCVGSPALTESLVIAGYGHGNRGSLYVAVRPEKANGTSPKIVYEVEQSAPLVPSPIVKDGLLFLWADDGVVSCLKADSGERVWRQRVGGAFYGSPIWLDGRLYCIAKDGEVVVLAASDKYAELARVELGEPSFATPAVANGVMYLRTRSTLFSLGGQPN